MYLCRVCGYSTNKPRWTRGYCPYCSAETPPIPWPNLNKEKRT